METNKNTLRLHPTSIVEIYLSKGSFMPYDEVVDLVRTALASVKPWQTTRGKPLRSYASAFDTQHNRGERNGREHYRVLVHTSTITIGIKQIFAYTEFVNSIVRAITEPQSDRIIAAHAVLSFKIAVGPHFIDADTPKELSPMYWSVL